MRPIIPHLTAEQARNALPQFADSVKGFGQEGASNTYPALNTQAFRGGKMSIAPFRWILSAVQSPIMALCGYRSI